MAMWFFSGRRSSARITKHVAMIEGLESRRLLSASPIEHPAVVSAPLAKLAAVAPKKILAGNTASDIVTIHNPTAAVVTEDVTITLVPSLDGSTAAGAYSSPSVTQTVTINKKGSVKLKVPFIPPTTLAAGKYHTLATVVIGTDTVNAVAPGFYTLTIPPASTTTPSLIGTYKGLSSGSSSTSGGGTITRKFGFIWQITGQTLTSLTGSFTIGDQTVVGTMAGSENTTGAITYTLASDLMNFTFTGTVTPDGSLISGTVHGTLVNNLFKKLGGKVKLTLSPS